MGKRTILISVAYLVLMAFSAPLIALHVLSICSAEAAERPPPPAALKESAEERPLLIAGRERAAESLAKMTLNCKVTAYSNDPYSINVPAWLDGRTATNAIARRGIVAADWAVFPPGTRLYIPGYGEALVEDRGSGVRGYHVDVFMDSREEAISWGIKDIDIIVIEFGRRPSET